MSSCNRNNSYNSWSHIPYPGEERVYHGIDHNAGSWPLVYFKGNEKGGFIDPNRKEIAFNMANPTYFNFKLQLAYVIKVNENLTPEQIAMAKLWGDWGTSLSVRVYTHDLN